MNLKKLIDLYYSALMLFLVFTFADHLLQGLIQCPCIDLILYTLMWLFLVLQTTLAYLHISKIKAKEYTLLTFILDTFDIGVAVYVCAAIGCTYGYNGYNELPNYCHLSAPFIVLSITQLMWFIVVNEYNVSAIFRISLLFIGMLAITISECVNHNFWNLVAIVSLIILLGILRCIKWRPKFFDLIAEKIWKVASKAEKAIEELLSSLKHKNS